MKLGRWLAVLCLACGCGAGCAANGRPETAPRLSVSSVTLHDHALRLHLSAPAPGTERAPILLVYATGDAGWWGKDRAIYSHLVHLGYAVVGFSAREYVHHLGKDTLRPREVAADYAAIVKTAGASLGLPPSMRAILVGKSRGAGLSVAAAGSALLKPQLAGVLAIGLTREEEYVSRRLRRSRPLVMLETYSYLPSLGELPVAVVQSSGDSYVPAAEARRLFGPDTAVRELISVVSSDHNFSDALDQMYEEINLSLTWITHR